METSVAAEVDEWQEDESLLRMKEFELALNLRLEKDEILAEEDV